MLTYPDIDPIAISLGPLKIHWYGITYLVGFAAAYLLGQARAKKANSPLQPSHIEDLIFYAAVGLVLGARFGYVLFYNFEKFLHDPLWLFAVWEGGMSFHGGLLGGFIALILYSRKIKVSILHVVDFVAPLAPIGIGAGRLGNFIGQELWGRATTSPFGMVFPNDPLHLVRHPSQLYEAFFEGVVLFAILFFYSRKQRPPLAVTGMALLFYGIFRFGVEFVREPDAHIGIDAFGWMTRGQILTTPLIALGLSLLVWAYVRSGRSKLVETKQ